MAIKMKTQNETKKRLVNLLRANAYALYCSTLSGLPTDTKRSDLCYELRTPKVGDLVMETTTHLMASRDPLEGIGTLISKEQEPLYTEKEWTEGGGDKNEIPARTVYVIRLDYDDGRLFRWSNASFIKIKADL